MTNITFMDEAIRVEYDVATEYVCAHHNHVSNKYYVLSQTSSRNSFISMFKNKSQGL